MAYKRYNKNNKPGKRFKPRKYTIYVARVSFVPLKSRRDGRPIRIKGWKNTKKFINKLNNNKRRMNLNKKAYAKRFIKQRKFLRG